MLSITYRPSEDTAFLDLTENAAVVERNQITVHSKGGEGIILHLTPQGSLVTIEIHNASKKLPQELLTTAASNLF